MLGCALDIPNPQVPVCPKAEFQNSYFHECLKVVHTILSKNVFDILFFFFTFFFRIFIREVAREFLKIDSLTHCWLLFFQLN